MVSLTATCAFTCKVYNFVGTLQRGGGVVDGASSVSFIKRQCALDVSPGGILTKQYYFYISHLHHREIE